MKNQVKKLVQTELEQLLVRVAVSSDFDKDTGFSGTGFFITPDGYLVTAWHCIQDAERFGKKFKILIECGDGELFPGQLDKKKSIQDLDIAVIKINRDINHNIPLLEHVPNTFKGDAVVSACYSEMYQNQKNCFSGEISLVDSSKVVTTNVIQGPGQSGSPIYHYESGRIIGIAAKIYNQDKLRNAGLAAKFDFLFQQWPKLKKINQNTAQLWDERLAAANEKSPVLDEQPTTTALTYEALEEQGILTELSRIFNYQASVHGLLRKVGFPRDQLPMFGAMTPLDVWQDVCQKIEDGLIEGGLEALLAAAASKYPHNKVFSQYKK